VRACGAEKSGYESRLLEHGVPTYGLTDQALSRVARAADSCRGTQG
jgi:hypothetical protein